MNEILAFLKDNGLLNIAIMTLGIFLMTMAAVYIPGRMFEIVKSFKAKNAIALVAAVFFKCFTKIIYQ